MSTAEKQRLDKINLELDRCWDLLRQRRALREFGNNPDEAVLWPANAVENYRGWAATGRAFPRSLPAARAWIMFHQHAIVWLDAREAKVISFDSDGVERTRVTADVAQERDNRAYFDTILGQVEAILGELDDWMIAGPDGARRDVEHYVRHHAGTLAEKLQAGRAAKEFYYASLLDIARRGLN